MAISVQCFATLSAYAPKQGKLDYVPEMSVKDVIDILGIPQEEVAVVFVNGVHSALEAKLQDGDRVGIFPAVGGG